MIEALWQAGAQAFASAQQMLFEPLAPLLHAVGLAHLLEDAYAACGWFLLGLMQVGVMLLVLLPLERWRRLEPVTDRAAVRTDIVYTLIHRLRRNRPSRWIKV